MNYRRLGNSNLRVSPLCLGTMMFGEQTPDDEAARIVASAREQGVNFIDTADVYNDGRSEQVLGRLLKGQRHDWVLASKIGNAMGQGPNQAHYSRQWLVRGVEASLARLDTDFLDILYLHRDYHEENLEEAVWALGDLIRAGKAARLRSVELPRLAHRRGHAPVRAAGRAAAGGLPAVLQHAQPWPRGRDPARLRPLWPGRGAVQPDRARRAHGQVPAGPGPGADTRAGRGDRRILATEFREESLRIAQRLVEHAAARGVQPGPFATAWVLANPLVSSVIAGPRTLAQMQDYYAALDLRITPEDETLVDDWVTPGHASTHG